MKKLICFVLSSFLFITSLLAIEKPIIQDIKAQVANASFISISWTLPDNSNGAIKKLWLYRSLSPIQRISDLKNADKIAELDFRLTGWTDILPDLNDYYYAVIAVTKSPYNVIVPSLNATTNGVHMPAPAEKPAEKIQKPEKIYESGNLRETPLPFLGSEIASGGILKDELSKSTIDSVKDLTYYSEDTFEVLKPYYFEEDLISPDGGDDFLLFSILKDYFIKRDFKNSITQLQRLIGTNISDSVQNRAYFYLGEALYYTGDYEESVRTFVKVSQIYPQQTKKWINSALDRI